MSDHESITQICHETRMLRLQAADLESQTRSVTQELEKNLERLRSLVERLREESSGRTPIRHRR
ncbi:MAG: hypothetical protein WCA44_09940 [Acidobacteriaceae bacterium]